MRQAYYNLGSSYHRGWRGSGQEDTKHYWELTAMNVDAESRYYYLCIEEGNAGYMNIDRAKKHHTYGLFW